MKTFALSLALCLIAVTAAQAKPPTCRTWQGMEVPYLGNPAVEGLGGATTDRKGRAIIALHPERLGQLPPLVADFWLIRECAQHAIHPNRLSEQAADCFAMKTMLKKRKIATTDQMETLQGQLRALPQDALPRGPMTEARITALPACFEN